MLNMFPQEKENWFPISSQYGSSPFYSNQHDSTEMAAGRIPALCRKGEHINLKVTSLLVSQHSMKVILRIEAVL